MNANAFPLHGLDYIQGEPVHLEKEVGQHVVVVEFWATWCPPCRQSIPHLTELQHKYPEIKFIGITNESKAVAGPFVKKMGNQMDYRVACDPNGSVSQKYMNHFNLQGIPAAVVISKSGKMVFAGHPMDAGFEAALQKCNNEPSAKKVDLSRETADSLNSKSVKELKEIAKSANISIAGCVEKGEIVAKLLSGK